MLLKHGKIGYTDATSTERRGATWARCAGTVIYRSASSTRKADARDATLYSKRTADRPAPHENSDKHGPKTAISAVPASFDWASTSW